MKHTILFVFVLLLVSFGCGRGSKKQSETASELEGEWTAVSADKDPMMTKGPTKAEFAQTKMSFKGQEFTMEVGKKPQGQGPFLLETNKTPKEIDLNGRKGIYKIEGDTLTICFAMQKGESPPTEFTPKPKTMTTLIVLKRNNP